MIVFLVILGGENFGVQRRTSVVSNDVACPDKESRQGGDESKDVKGKSLVSCQCLPVSFEC